MNTKTNVNAPQVTAASRDHQSGSRELTNPPIGIPKTRTPPDLSDSGSVTEIQSPTQPSPAKPSQLLYGSCTMADKMKGALKDAKQDQDCNRLAVKSVEVEGVTATEFEDKKKCPSANPPVFLLTGGITFTS